MLTTAHHSCLLMARLLGSPSLPLDPGYTQENSLLSLLPRLDRSNQIKHTPQQPASMRTTTVINSPLPPHSRHPLGDSHCTYNQFNVTFRGCVVLHDCCFKAQVLDELSYSGWLDDLWIILDLCLSRHQGDQHRENTWNHRVTDETGHGNWAAIIVSTVYPRKTAPSESSRARALKIGWA